MAILTKATEPAVTVQCRMNGAEDRVFDMETRQLNRCIMDTVPGLPHFH